MAEDPAAFKGTPATKTSQPPHLAAWLVTGGILFAAATSLLFVLEGRGRTLTGTISVFDPALNSSCEGSAEFSDVGPKTAITVEDQAGKTIATGRLGKGEYVSAGRCDYSFTIEDVPGAESYRVAFSDRGELEYSQAEMRQMRWNLSLEVRAEAA